MSNARIKGSFGQFAGRVQSLLGQMLHNEVTVNRGRRRELVGKLLTHDLDLSNQIIKKIIYRDY